MRLNARSSVTLTATFAALVLATGCSASAPAVGTETVAPAPSAAPSSAPSAATPSSAPSTGTPSGPAQASTGTTGSGDAVVLGSGDDYSIEESGITVSITCEDGGTISIDADGVNLTVNGTCEDIDVDGDSNTVTAQDADEFDVDGDSNTLTGTAVRAITIDGDENTASVRSTTDVDLDGSANTVTYAEGEPDLDGDENDNGNSVTRG